jgi:outer membrane receptor protein involved in Fe transport
MISTTMKRIRMTTIVLLAAAGATAARAADHKYDIPAGDLGTALATFAKQSGGHIVVPADVVAGRKSRSIEGVLSEQAALADLLAGSGLHAELVAGAYVVRADRDEGVAASRPSDEILVTGTRIRGAAPTGAPLTVISRDAIERSGRATVADYIQTLPQNFSGGENEANVASNPRASDNLAYGSSINLRGLGTESTLVLFDGSRPAVGGTVGAFVDTSLIPTNAIERIEVLTDGASAIYGTDAVAGVVNIRFRDRYDGFETHLYSGAAGSAFTQLQASQAYGKRWGNGGLFLAYQYDHRGRLRGNDRAVATQDLRRFGGPDLRDDYSLPGTIVAADGEIFGIPPGQDGRDLTAADLHAGAPNLTDLRKRIDLLPRQETHSIYGAFDQSLSSNFSIYARALFARRAYDTTLNPNSLQPYTVPTTNPFYVDPIGTGEPVDVDYDFTSELGPYRTSGRLRALTTSAGVKATPGPWTITLEGSFGHSATISHETNSTSSSRIAAALADTDRETALNLFGDGSDNNPATLAFIRSSYRDYVRSTVWSAALRADGPLFDLPAGTVKLATGVERRHEHFASGYFYDSTEASPGIFDEYVTPGTPGSRHVDAIYGELSIPLVRRADGSFPGRLDASLAGRVDRYSDVGRTANPKAGLSWTPATGVTLRGSWGTSFRAPTFYENAGPSRNEYVPYPAPDPASPTGTTPALVIDGYAADIRPEKATSWTAGADLKPVAIQGLTLGATYFDIAYRDRIASPVTYLPQILVQPDIYASLIEAATPSTVAAYYASPQLNNFYGIAASDIRYILHLETQNLSRVTVRGVDFNFAYTRPLLRGIGSVDLTGTRLIAIDQRITSDSPATNVLGLFYNPVRWRLRGHGGWARAGLSIDGFVNYTDGYLNNQVTPSQHVDSWTTVDAQIGYRFKDSSPLKGARLALSATNLFNRRPPYALNSVYGSTVAFDPNQASAIGRLISIDMTFQW